MIFLIVFLPLASVIITLLLTRLIGRTGVSFITTFFVFLSFLFSCMILTKNSVIHYNLFSWISVGVLNIHWGFYVDSVTSLMLLIITFISFLVHLYSIEYMESDPHLPRFMAYLSLFTFAMLMLVTANNFIQMFFGWEGVGLVSYLLINFWHTRMQANKSAMKAIIVNRIGDFGLILAIFAIFSVFKSLDFSTIFALVDIFAENRLSFMGFNLHAYTVITLLIFIGSIGKSAQLGLHTWLPDAMEGPTPVSALIHAATMVTAGVFILIRCSPLLQYSPFALIVITIMGGLTAFFAATVALVQNDLKRIIAYSTCSQLGYMIFACGMSAYNVAMFHLVNHAFFKALLFLAAGSVIHALADEQDIRRMGGLANMIPLTYSVMVIGSLSLIGFPFLTGFYSKDLILEVAYCNFTFEGRFVYWLGSFTACLTAFYSMRLLYFTFIGSTNAYKSSLKNVHEPRIYMTVPLLLLALGSILFGYLFKDMLVGLGSDFWNNSLPFNNELLINSEFIPPLIKLIPVLFSLISALSAYFLFYTPYLYLLKVNSLELYRFLNKRWYFDVVYNNYIVLSVLKFGYKISFITLDRGFLELLGPKGLALIINHLAFRVIKLQTGYVYHYLFLTFFSLFYFLCITFYFFLFDIDILKMVFIVLYINEMDNRLH